MRDTLEDPTATNDDLAAVVGRDPSLAARLLKIANSAFYGFRSQVETISRASAILGMQKIHDLVLAASVTKAFDGIKGKLGAGRDDEIVITDVDVVVEFEPVLVGMQPPHAGAADDAPGSPCGEGLLR